mgnify:CR=1 FL=1
MELQDRIENLLAPIAEEHGLNIVRIRFGGEGRQRTLQIMVERLDDEPVDLAECGSFSREASALLDVEDWIDDAYNLEVSSAGMERPLIKLEDFDRFKGRTAKIDLHDLVDGQKRFKGILKGVSDNDEILLEREDTKDMIELPFTSLHRAKLVVTDAMINEAKRKSKEKNKASK